MIQIFKDFLLKICQKVIFEISNKKDNVFKSNPLNYKYFHTESLLASTSKNQMNDFLNNLIASIEVKTYQTLEIKFESEILKKFETTDKISKKVFNLDDKSRNIYNISTYYKNKFDLIFFSSGIEFLSKPWIVIDEFKKMINHNGFILIQTNYSTMHYNHKQSFFQISGKGFESLFTKEEGYNTIFNTHKNEVKGRFTIKSLDNNNYKPFNNFIDVSFCTQKINQLVDIKHTEINQITDVKNLYPIKKHIKNLLIDKKLNILIGCLSFKNRTGSELYVFELAKKLVQENHNVSICSDIGEPLFSEAIKLGINLYPLEEPPGFKLGNRDIININNELFETNLNTLYKINESNFDIIHLNHNPVTEHLLRLYPETPIICSIHSEIIDLENPIISPQIKKYIAIRPEIKNYLIEKFNISSDKIELIYNPIDEERFKILPSSNCHRKKRILFVGTIDYLRKKTLIDLITSTKINNEELWIVGKQNDNYLYEILEGMKHVSYFEPSDNIENYIYQCDETAGILLGRTTIEGWMCGKKGWIYKVDDKGDIIDKKLHNIPSNLDKFHSSVVVKQILNQYLNILS